jgi:protocatechuate 3,4-dioxygenase beta subunit
MSTITRRSALHALGLGAAALPLAKLTGCGSTTGSTGVDAPTSTGDTAPPVDGGGDTCGPAAAAWAMGGTAAMTAKACYPDPFGPLTTCSLVCATTAGPCTAPTTSRVDVSDGLVGLPVRLALKIVRADTCAPVQGAVVEIWHTQRTGVYSGQTPSPGFCSGGDAEAPTKNYFRGTQTSDANGRVDFDTCFPGWYPGRCIHIHVSVKIGTASYVVTQLFFADNLNQEIFATHPEYSQFGQPNTSNTADGIFGAANVVEAARMSDGAMLAWKVIGIRSSTNQSLCNL